MPRPKLTRRAILGVAAITAVTAATPARAATTPATPSRVVGRTDRRRAVPPPPPRWETDLPDAVRSQPAHGAGMVCVVVGETLWCLDAADGRMRWRIPVGQHTANRSTPLIVDADQVVLATWEGSHGDAPRHAELLAVNAGDGATRWRAELPYAVTAAGRYGAHLLLAADRPRFVQCRDWRTGAVRWNGTGSRYRPAPTAHR
ncbi:outer membrane protein assembly factor BamB family protein, partial [Pilimelia terevasa]|uniref:outer membrane protein assembly factor BamB family protein n=1 Tax=Pilimelia terevasa TaxID=53372 RepID=UPI00166CEF8E